MKFIPKNKQGFTLVELLIVVAIIGILSTVGIPTFKKMVQKSKKSEAKVALGGLYTAEAAFFSEYGAYGNYLDKIGFEMSGGGGTVYSMGFTTSACADTAAMPLLADAAGATLLLTYPSYYPGGADPATVGFSFMKTTGGKVPTACEPAVVTAAGTSFLATATGAIDPSASLAAITGATGMDTWTIDEARALSNKNDGVH
ncbi:MAG: prepilin-type N-terminal cleavage/methylation domain-containing protein [Deltaproteobacteria bacterium]|nr:prepilin-type N-terminal cleavage/methylation domain-containing protein [Deltaproteobacteria bacterium]MBI3293473.1 prepilin-type N-terminal cleavage/methylation domain-containing protein [Deltaproteobacteria bacterium]